jgi:hypothetical protein
MAQPHHADHTGADRALADFAADRIPPWALIDAQSLSATGRFLANFFHQRMTKNFY